MAPSARESCLVECSTEHTLDERRLLTRRIMDLLDGWGLSASDVASILQLPQSIKTRHLGRFRDAEPFPDDPRVNRRVAYLARIEDALLTYFPRNPEMRSLWVKRGNTRFGRRSPVALMVEDGESGMISVLSHLDCTFAWDLTGSRSDYGNDHADRSIRQE
ncbi:DUF2384 domain-containing protein [Thiorhodococcus fuscus]|uniref:DUF2384 domain-containing protein n=1 Tax=Thiorhodococcus fuscus TaxID=527200 RepID=A0ABW4YEP8_9GAMM